MELFRSIKFNVGDGEGRHLGVEQKIASVLRLAFSEQERLEATVQPWAIDPDSLARVRELVGDGAISRSELQDALEQNAGTCHFPMFVSADAESCSDAIVNEARKRREALSVHVFADGAWIALILKIDVAKSVVTGIFRWRDAHGQGHSNLASSVVESWAHRGLLQVANDGLSKHGAEAY